jgi:hypothetical protein
MQNILLLSIVRYTHAMPNSQGSIPPSVAALIDPNNEYPDLSFIYSKDYGDY